ncbi:hypothetical protein SDC9_160261 [bioreactor metagenome]|uniref:Uncharacterized protein n=1 Tax=bioreactor metagenome TaxID=1076179 RepID=A0A645FEY9_9ZZZZ
MRTSLPSFFKAIEAFKGEALGVTSPQLYSSPPTIVNLGCPKATNVNETNAKIEIIDLFIVLFSKIFMLCLS